MILFYKILLNDYRFHLSGHKYIASFGPKFIFYIIINLFIF
jgi:hypothetical protein